MVATTSILGDLVAAVAGDDVEVRVLIPAGADPHGFAPSARDAARLRDAALVVANGLGLEAGIGAALDAAADDGVTVLEVAPLVDPLPWGGTDDDHDHDDHADDDHDQDDHADDDHDHDDHADDDHADDDHDDHDHGDLDPHVWHDPTRMAAAVPALVDALGTAIPDLDAAALAERGDALVADLHALDDEVRALLDVVPGDRRVLVTNHDTLGYLADRYGFEVVGVLISGGDTLARPSPSEVAALAAVVAAQGVPAIFAEVMVDDSLATALAEAAGTEVQVVRLHTDALGEPGSGADTYAGMLRTNAELIAGALS